MIILVQFGGVLSTFSLEVCTFVLIVGGGGDLLPCSLAAKELLQPYTFLGHYTAKAT